MSTLANETTVKQYNSSKEDKTVLQKTNICDSGCDDCKTTTASKKTKL